MERACDEYILWLDIAMNQTLGMKVSKAREEGLEDQWDSKLLSHALHSMVLSHVVVDISLVNEKAQSQIRRGAILLLFTYPCSPLKGHVDKMVILPGSIHGNDAFVDKAAVQVDLARDLHPLNVSELGSLVNLESNGDTRATVDSMIDSRDASSINRRATNIKIIHNPERINQVRV